MLTKCTLVAKSSRLAMDQPPASPLHADEQPCYCWRDTVGERDVADVTVDADKRAMRSGDDPGRA
jgi:hypothetical protein